MHAYRKKKSVSARAAETSPSIRCYWILVSGLLCRHAASNPITAEMHVVRWCVSNKEAQKRLTESNGTPAMDFGCQEIRKRKYTQTKNRTKHTTTIVI